MKFEVGDTVLAETIDGATLCTVKRYNENGNIELEPYNQETVAWSKCWLKPEVCKLVKAAPRLKAVK